MKNIFTLALLLVAVMAVSCSGMQKFDRVGGRNGKLRRYDLHRKHNQRTDGDYVSKEGRFSRRVTTKKDRNDG